jgi:hypothetical protein
LLDSILRQISPDPATVDGQSIPRKQLDIVHYAKLYAARFEIPTSKSILMLTPPRYLTPFSAWVALLSGSGYQPATWWRIHTDLKHDRIANLKKATLEVAIDSLCGLHLIVASLPDFAEAILRRGWVPGNKFSPSLTIKLLQGKPEAQSISQLVESKLFIIARGREKFPDRIEDFQPGEFNGSERVIDFFGRSY